MKNVNRAELTVFELIALLFQDISRKCLGSFLSSVYNACAVVTDFYILRRFCSHHQKSCAVVIVNLAVLTISERVAVSHQRIFQEVSW